MRPIVHPQAEEHLDLRRGHWRLHQPRVTHALDEVAVVRVLLWPQLLLWAVNLIAITWGANRFIYDYSPAVIVNLIWITYHFLLLSSLFYFNEEWS